jgi:hypothetical protein
VQRLLIIRLVLLGAAIAALGLWQYAAAFACVLSVAMLSEAEVWELRRRLHNRDSMARHVAAIREKV